MNGTLLNVALFVHDASEFPEPEKMVVPATRGELERAIHGWGPHVAEIAKLFPENIVKWGIFDLDQHPVPMYARGRVCIVGDAAHASSPFQGVGACIGVEDALVISEVLDVVRAHNFDESSLSQGQASAAVRRALQAYSQARMERGQWVVRSSREMGEMYQWRYGPTGRDPEKSKLKLERASQKIWDYDVGAMVASVKAAAA